jgi:hypothetical protein
VNPPPTARPALTSISFDLPCLGCRYNLRTLTAAAVCPECGLPIVRTLDHGWLIFADAAWLRRVHSGLSLLLLSMLFAPVGIAGIVLYVVAASGVPDEVTIVVASWAVSVVLIALWLFGVWGVTAPELASKPGSAPLKLGWCVRVFHVIALVAFAASYYIAAGVDETALRGPLDWLRLVVPTLITWTAYVLGFFALVAHVRRLARRSTKALLQKLLTFIHWGGIVVAVFAVSGGAIAIVATFGTTITPAPTTMSVQAVPMGVSVSWTPTTAPTTGPAAVAATTMPTSAPFAATAVPMRGPMVIGMAVGGCFYLFILIWGIAWLVALIALRRALKQTINDNAAAAYAVWRGSSSPVPSAPDDSSGG